MTVLFPSLRDNADKLYSLNSRLINLYEATLLKSISSSLKMQTKSRLLDKHPAISKLRLDDLLVLHFIGKFTS